MDEASESGHRFGTRHRQCSRVLVDGPFGQNSARPLEIPPPPPPPPRPTSSSAWSSAPRATNTVAASQRARGNCGHSANARRAARSSVWPAPDAASCRAPASPRNPGDAQYHLARLRFVASAELNACAHHIPRPLDRCRLRPNRANSKALNTRQPHCHA